jgi:hypothetical protein
VRADPARGDLGPQGSLAAALDDAAGRLQQDRQITAEQLRCVLAEPQQAVPLRLYLFAVVEDIGHVPGRLGQLARQPELDRHAGLHVTAATAVQQVSLRVGGDVARDRHGVEVPGQDHPLRPAKVGPRDDGVPVPPQSQVGQARQGTLDRVGQHLLVTAHRRDIDQGRR